MTPALIILVIILLIVGLIIYWLFFATEGVYLGQRTVTRLYDIYAERYDNIKQYDAEWEQNTLAEPILEALQNVPQPLILDVATGTARLPISVLGTGAFNGRFIGLDVSLKMLQVAAAKVAAMQNVRDQVTFVHHDAQRLPFDDHTFDAVCCLEALEFVPDAKGVLAEIVRVAKPGAVIVLTNRKGWQTLLYPFKTQTTKSFLKYLRQQLGLEDVTATLWQLDYDLIFAFKTGLLPTTDANSTYDLLRCPNQHRALTLADSTLCCAECGVTIPIDTDGIIDYGD
jgi:ubiquinone/menaquinone biosynthesis C-methylase UbiE